MSCQHVIFVVGLQIILWSSCPVVILWSVYAIPSELQESRSIKETSVCKLQ